MKNTLIFYKDWYEAISGLSPEERLQAYEAVFGYAFDEVEPDDKFIKAATKLMLSTIDRDNGKYEQKCERNRRNVIARWKRLKEAGNASNTTEYDRIQTHTTATDNDNDNGNDNDNDNDNEKKEKTPNGVKKKVAAATAAPVAPQQEGKAKRFARPSVEEVRAYCEERGNGVSAEAFVDFYESKGWKVGNSPMKDWRAAVRTWEKRDGRGVRRTASPNSGVTLGVDEWIDEQGNRLYGSGKRVPMSAPPRPGADYYWSRESNSWIAGV